MRNNETLFPLLDNEIAIIVDSGIELEDYSDAISEYISKIDWKTNRYIVAVLKDDIFHFASYTEQDFEIANQEGFKKIYEGEEGWENIHPFEALLMVHYKTVADEVFGSSQTHETVVYTTTIYQHMLN